MQQVKRFQFDKRGYVDVPDDYTILAVEKKGVVAVRQVSQEIHIIASVPASEPEDGFSPACFLPEDEGVEETLRYCDVCAQYVGPAHTHVGETIKERDTSDWANSIHRKCEVCDWEADIFPLSNGSFGSELDYCNRPEYCEAPWGMGQDHDRRAVDYVEHDGQEKLAPLFCMWCGFDSTKFTGVEDCTTEDGFHKFVQFMEGDYGGETLTLDELQEAIQRREAGVGEPSDSL